MAKGFYLKLAWANVKRNRLTYVPYLLATALISGVFLMITGMIFSKDLRGVPSGETAQSVFTVGMVVFAIFTIFFMLYVNNFLVKRRKTEFGLYGVLGLEKRHVRRVLLFENLIVTVGGLILGTVFALVFGYLCFMLLLKLIDFAGNSSFSLPPIAFLLTYGLFAGIFLGTSIVNSIRVSLIDPKTLLQSDKRGESDSKLTVPIAIIGMLILTAAYFLAWTTDNPMAAVGIYFILVLMVIVATFMLFRSGSITLLKAMRANKRYYYKSKHFVTVSGMFHRMRQNARGLSFICILSTMLVVTVSSTLSLYLGREKMLQQRHPYDVETQIHFSRVFDLEGARLDEEYAKYIFELADEHGVTVVVNANKHAAAMQELGDDGLWEAYNVTKKNGLLVKLSDVYESFYCFDLEGDSENCRSFCKALSLVRNNYPEDMEVWISKNDIFTERESMNAVYGGLLFMGAFFGILFLVMAVLIIYFKQVTEGYEDRERFVILQKVGMDARTVKGTINSQILWVFFLPLAATVLHMIFESKIMSNLLMIFGLNDWPLVLGCIGGTLVVFVLIYLLVFRLTAKAYYRIVAR